MAKNIEGWNFHSFLSSLSQSKAAKHFHWVFYLCWVYGSKNQPRALINSTLNPRSLATKCSQHCRHDQAASSLPGFDRLFLEHPHELLKQWNLFLEIVSGQLRGTLFSWFSLCSDSCSWVSHSWSDGGKEELWPYNLVFFENQDFQYYYYQWLFFVSDCDLFYYCHIWPPYHMIYITY